MQFYPVTESIVATQFVQDLMQTGAGFAAIPRSNSYEALFQKSCLLPYGGVNCKAAAFLDFAATFFVVGSKLHSWVICALCWV